MGNVSMMQSFAKLMHDAYGWCWWRQKNSCKYKIKVVIIKGRWDSLMIIIIIMKYDVLCLHVVVQC